jgi:hypothetical protein
MAENKEGSLARVIRESVAKSSETCADGLSSPSRFVPEGQRILAGDEITGSG